MMKKKSIIIFICIMVICLSGCGNKKELSMVFCKYNASEENVGVEVKMQFERDNEAELITKGFVSMSYEFADITSSDVTTTSNSSVISSMFDGICDNLSSIYKDCNLNIDGNNAEIIMEFDLDILESSSGGTFKKNMTISQVKGYIQAQSEIDGLVCMTE